MAIEVVMPQMGESIAEGTLVRWLKNVGEHVERDEPLFEISTDKVDTEIPSPSEGILQEIRVAEGETVPVQTIVAVLGASGEVAAPAEAAPAVETPSPAPAVEKKPAAAAAPDSKPAPAPASSPAPAPTPAAPAPTPAATETVTVEKKPAAAKEVRSERVRRRSSPLVRRIAREHEVDLAEVPGTGSSGRVTKHDILSYIDSRKSVAGGSEPAAAPSTPTAAPEGTVEIKRLSTMRRKIAEHMMMSKHTSAHVTTVFEVDMTNIAKLIAANKEAFLRKNGVKLTYLPFIIKATISALREFPIVNASLVDDHIHFHKLYSIGIAVALEQGLLVPVIKEAEEKSLLGLSRAVYDLATRARSKKLQPDEVQGGTFTITNHGVFGSLFATPVINQPQVAILGVGTVTKRPVVLPETDAIAVRSMMYLGLSFDHRLIDGATADRFVAHIKSELENRPYSIS